MTKRIGIREVTRNFSILDEYDYVEIEDKKTHKVKGMFIFERLLDDVREYIEQKAEKERWYHAVCGYGKWKFCWYDSWGDKS